MDWAHTLASIPQMNNAQTHHLQIHTTTGKKPRQNNHDEDHRGCAALPHF
jgi:hypothetical protein